MGFVLKKEIVEVEYDKCIICGKDTPFTKDIHIDHRLWYIEGAGQCCRDCY